MRYSKFLILSLALLTFFGGQMDARKTRKDKKNAEKVDTCSVDTFSYAIGLANSDGLKNYLANRMGVDMGYMGKQGIAVNAAAQRRVHLEAPVLLQILVAEKQVVRGRLATHAQAPGLGATYQFDALTGRHMADMVLAAGLFRERDVTFHLPPLAFRTDALMPVLTAVLPVVDIAAPQQVVDLAVRHDRLPDLRSTAHRLFHQAVRLHAAAIVRKADDLGRQRREIDQTAAAALPHRDAAVGDYAHDGIAADDVGLRTERLRSIGRRVQVRHRTDRRVSAPCGRGRSGGDGLLLRESRFAQVDVHVHESRNHMPAAEVHGPVGRGARDGHDAASRDGELPGRKTKLPKTGDTSPDQ